MKFIISFEAVSILHLMDKKKITIFKNLTVIPETLQLSTDTNSSYMKISK